MSTPEPMEMSQARAHAAETRSERLRQHEHMLVYERLGVLEVLLVNLDRCPSLNRSALDGLLADLREIFTDTKIALNVHDDPPRLMPRSARAGAAVADGRAPAITNSTEVP